MISYLHAGGAELFLLPAIHMGGKLMQNLCFLVAGLADNSAGF